MATRLNYSLTQLEYVMAVHKHGHFAKAAEACLVTQPTLSMQIQKLEHDLGAVIFDRSKKPILLTDVGKRIIEQVRAILSEARKLESLIQASESAELTGELTVGVIPTLAPYLLPRLLPVLEKKHPGVSLRIRELQTHRIVESLNEDELDAGLLATPLDQSSIQEKRLFYEPFSALVGREHELNRLKKVSYDAMKFEDLWLLEEGHCLRHQILDVCSLKRSKKVKRRYEFESGSLETLKSLVDHYGGYTLLPSLAAGSIGRHTNLIPFERPIPAREIGLVFRRDQYKRKLLDAVADAVIECIPDELRKIRPKDLDVLPVE